MGNSLQDQLVQAGLAQPDQARKDERRGKKPQQRKPKGKGKDKPQGKGKPANKARNRDQRDAGGERGGSPDRAPEPGSREAVQRLRTLVKRERLPRDEADTPYRFTSGTRIKEITVTGEQQRRLAAGEAAIVNVQGHYDVVPAHLAEQVKGLDPKALVVLNEPDPETDADDPYADRPVPDDLTW